MVPRFTEFYIPVLQVMSNVEPIDINDLIDSVADHVNLSYEDRLITTGSGTQYRYRSNISWAVTDLNQGNFIERVKRGSYVITMAGLELLEENIENIDRACLAARSESFRAFMEKKGTRKGKSSEEELTTDMQELSEVEEDSEDESTEVSLEELRQIRETLKKAKIPTTDIDQKIKELEVESFFNTLLPGISQLIPEALGRYTEKLSFTVEFIPRKEISVTFGDSRRIVTLPENVNLSKKEKKTLIGSVSSTLQESKNIIRKSNVSGDNPTIVISQEPRNTNIEESSERKSKGVWIEPYKDRMIVVKGDTEPFNDLFASYGGRFVNNPSEGWKGWIFMSNREEGLRKDLSGVLVGNPSAPCSSNITSTESSRNSNPSEYELSVKRYLDAFDSLRRFTFLGITGPHKAILLVSIFQGIRNGMFQENKIKFSSDLEALYNENWKIFIGGFPSLGAVYPFVHLGRDSFFMHKLIRPIIDYDKTWSRHSLERHIDYAVIDKKLVELVKSNEIFNQFVDFLIQRYCTESLSGYSAHALLKNKKDNIAEVNQKEAFLSYLSNTDSKSGKSFSKKSIVVYVRALNSIHMNELVSKHHSTSDIFNILDLNVLYKIKQEIEDSCKVNKTLLVPKSALALYIKYVKTLS